MMFSEMLRTYILGAVVCALIGVGIGFGWHYFVDLPGGRVAASATISLAKQDAPNPPSPNSTAARETPVPDVPRIAGASDAQQSARSTAFDLSNDEQLALVTLLTRSIAYDRYPSSPRVRTLQSILLKLSSPKTPAPPTTKHASVHHRK
jgi:hypothetical protein